MSELRLWKGGEIRRIEDGESITTNRIFWAENRTEARRHLRDARRARGDGEVDRE